jgi:hypothetical protein
VKTAAQFSTWTGAFRIRSITHWTPMDVLKRIFVELQNRSSASLAMSTDGSFPSRLRHFQFRTDTSAVVLCQ